MTSCEFTRAEQMIAYFVRHCERSPGRTRLMKLLYLTDFESRRAMGHPLSELKYVWYNHGPYDFSLNAHLRRLSEAGVIEEVCVQYPYGATGYEYSAGPVEIPLLFKPEEDAVLDYVCRMYSTGELRDLLEDVVYETAPMKIAQEQGALGVALNMDSVNFELATALRVPFATLVQRSAAARRGEYTSSDAFFAAL